MFQHHYGTASLTHVYIHAVCQFLGRLVGGAGGVGHVAFEANKVRAQDDSYCSRCSVAHNYSDPSPTIRSVKLSTTFEYASTAVSFVRAYAGRMKASGSIVAVPCSTN